MVIRLTYALENQTHSYTHFTCRCPRKDPISESALSTLALHKKHSKEFPNFTARCFSEHRRRTPSIRNRTNRPRIAPRDIIVSPPHPQYQARSPNSPTPATPSNQLSHVSAEMDRWPPPCLSRNKQTSRHHSVQRTVANHLRSSQALSLSPILTVRSEGSSLYTFLDVTVPSFTPRSKDAVANRGLIIECRREGNAIFFRGPSNTHILHRLGLFFEINRCALRWALRKKITQSFDALGF